MRDVGFNNEALTPEIIGKERNGRERKDREIEGRKEVKRVDETNPKMEAC